jgi:hypothetical protein
MEFKGIPHGHLYIPDPSVTRTIKVASLKDLAELIGKPTVNQSIEYTDLEDIDDTMDMDLARIGLISVPDIHEGYGTTAEEFSNDIQRAIRLSEEYLKQEEKNANNT